MRDRPNKVRRVWWKRRCRFRRHPPIRCSAESRFLSLILVAGLLTVFGYYASSICITVILAGFLAILFDPVVVMLEKMHLPRSVAAAGPSEPPAKLCKIGSFPLASILKMVPQPYGFVANITKWDVDQACGPPANTSSGTNPSAAPSCFLNGANRFSRLSIRRLMRYSGEECGTAIMIIETDPSDRSGAKALHRYELAGAYDEMFSAVDHPRKQYRPLYNLLLNLGPDELRRSKYEADQSFFNQGITFTVYGSDKGTERIFPHDLLPRIITAVEWERIERGLTQRITALNLFLKDVYHDGKIIEDGVVPAIIVYTCKHYRREMRGIKVPRDVYITVVGTDLIRNPEGNFVVLEDNLRVPSGVSYMLTSRRVMKQIFPGLFQKCRVRPIEQYSQELLSTLRFLAPEGRSEPTVVLLTPGAYNSAYFEHTYLARRMGIELV